MARRAGRDRAAGGDLAVAEAMARVDWEATPVGPPATWPPLLAGVVRLLLASEFSMWLGWGPELAFFYNDAYRRDTLGVKHPWALGRPAREVWEEIWGDIGPRLAHVQQGNSTWDEALLLFLERSGYREETYHTFSYSPVTAPDGSVAGVLCVVTEETDRVIGERRLATLRQLAAELSRTREEAQVYEAVASELAKNPYDLPYALVYTFEDEGERQGDGGGAGAGWSGTGDEGAVVAGAAPGGVARLACAVGTEPGAPVAPAVLDGSDRTWPVGRLLESNATVVLDDVLERCGDAPGGFWDLPAQSAVMLPLAQHAHAAPAGFLVAGVNPYRELDGDARAFFELLGGQIAAGIANARAYEAERRRAEALADLDRAKTEFFSNVSHEFRTPLTLILGPAEDALADDVEPLPPRQAARLEVIRRNARRLRRLVNDMLDFARVEGGRLRAETEPTDIAELTRDVAASFAPVIERADLTLVIDCPPAERTINVDRDMWEKILLNLLSNAFKFTMEGEIRVRLRTTPDAAVLSVADTGVGIGPEELPHLFERFYRGPRGRARSHEGTGIGLALVYQFVQLHGGTIEASSAPGRGTTFTVTVPLGGEATSTGAVQRGSSRQAYLDEALQWLGGADPAEAASVMPAGGAREARVLVVDDNPDMRRHVTRILEPFWEVSVANNGAVALDAVRRVRPDLVLTDVMMGELDGFALLRALRADPQTATIPVVFLSARAGEDAAIEGLDAGADDYLVKPFSALELVARVRSNLELAAMRNEESMWRTALVEALDEAVAVLDPTGAVIEVNESFERMLGFPRDALPYLPPYPWFPRLDETPRAARTAGEALRRALASGRFEGNLQLRHRDGRVVHVSGVVDSVEVAGKRRYVAALRDVTAELLAGERDSALATMGIRLAEAGDVGEVVAAATTELRRIFRASRAGVERGGPAPEGPGEDGHGPLESAAGAPPTSEGPSGPASGAVTLARRGRQVVMAAPGAAREPAAQEEATAEGAPVGAAVAAIAAPLDPATDAGAVWVELEPPRPVTAEERSLFAVLAGYIGQALRRAQLFDDSRMVATAMQRSILGPTQTPADVAVRYLPAVEPLEVGGDWYDVVELPGDRLGIVVGDCVGRGLPAATVMGQLRSACRALLLQADSTATVVGALDVFAERIPDASCTTMFCAIVHRATGELRLSSAGHIPAVLLGSDGSAALVWQPGSVPLAVVPGAVRAESTLHLAPGDAVVVCTDGLVERRGESLDVGLDRLQAAAAESGPGDPDALADHLLRRLIPGDGQEDDVAIVVYRHGPLQPGVRDEPQVRGAREQPALPGARDEPPQPGVVREEPPQPGAFRMMLGADTANLVLLRRRLRAWLGEAGVDPLQVTDILVACGEAASNAMEHAYDFDPARDVAVRGRLDGTGVVVTVSDRGRWKPAANPGIERGRGLAIMRGLMDDVTVETTDDGTTVVLRTAVRDGG